jgi:hypothetical protein
VRKLVLVTAAVFVASALSACSASDSETPQSSASAGAWTTQQQSYLQEIYASGLAANDVLPEDVYIGLADIVCQGLTQGTKADALLALLATTAEQNGLPATDRAVFGPTVAAAAVTYVCPENITKLVE